MASRINGKDFASMNLEIRKENVVTPAPGPPPGIFIEDGNGD